VPLTTPNNFMVSGGYTCRLVPLFFIVYWVFWVLTTTTSTIMVSGVYVTARFTATVLQPALVHWGTEGANYKWWLVIRVGLGAMSFFNLRYYTAVF